MKNQDWQNAGGHDALQQLGDIPKKEVNYYENMLGKKIKKIRKANKLTQEEFSDVLGVSRASVSELERGNRELKAIELKKICDELGIRPEIILEDNRPIELEELFSWEREFDDKFGDDLVQVVQNSSTEYSGWFHIPIKEDIKEFIKKQKIDAFRRGYNQRLKDEGKTGRKYEHLYL